MKVVILVACVIILISNSVLVKADLKAITHENTLRFEAGKVDDDICKCDTTSCNCCKTVTAEGITKTVCIQVSYKAPDTDFDIMVSADGSKLFTAKVPVSNPQQQCTTIPVQGVDVKVCVNFENVKVDNTGLSGCMKLVISAMGQSFTIDFGCFKTGSEEHENDFGNLLLNLIKKQKREMFENLFRNYLKTKLTLRK